AVIGDENPVVDGVIAAPTFIDVAEDVNARAIVAGQLWSFTLAGAMASTTPDVPEPPAAGAPTADTATDAAKPSQFNADVAPQAAGASKSGLGIAAAVSINLVNDNTQASIADAGHLKAGDVSITTENKLAHVAATG